ncbi:MAG: hypothetical protein E7361_03865 [Clostridiales bacterium]|nr:hypothetical protein [Clostridiales bacterium]
MSTKQHVIFLTIISVMTLAMIGMAITLVLASNHNKLDNNMSVEYEIESPDLVINIVNESNIRSMIKGFLGYTNPSYMSYDNTKEGNSYTAESLLDSEEYDSGIGDFIMYGDCANYTFTFSTPSGKTNTNEYYFDGIEFLGATYSTETKNYCSLQFSNYKPNIDISMAASSFDNYSEWEPGTILTITISDPGENRNSQYDEFLDEKDYFNYYASYYIIEIKDYTRSCTTEISFHYSESYLEGSDSNFLQPINSTNYNGSKETVYTTRRLYYKHWFTDPVAGDGLINLEFNITNTSINDLSILVEEYYTLTDFEGYTTTYTYNPFTILTSPNYDFNPYRIVITINNASN